MKDGVTIEETLQRWRNERAGRKYEPPAWYYDLPECWYRDFFEKCPDGVVCKRVGIPVLIEAPETCIKCNCYIRVFLDEEDMLQHQHEED